MLDNKGTSMDSRQKVRAYNLPTQLRLFIGREAEITEIGGLIEDEACHLLTLVGPGGIGKTRLAIEVAKTFGDQNLTTDSLFTDGVFFVPLAPLISPNSIVPTIANTLGFQFYQENPIRNQLLDYLHDRQLLLVMDNFEHLLDGSDILTDILQTAPGVKVLVTSRLVLGIKVEWVREVVGLTVPHNKHERDISTYTAAQLFADRARQIRGSFSVDTEKDDVTQICQLVAGVPLAIELAATWIRALPCAAIANEIQANVDFLASRAQDMPERHQSMRVVFDHSWGLLTEHEQAILRRLSIFRAGFTREAAHGITQSSLNNLADLVDKSFISVDEFGRFSIHELVRQYAEEKLEAADEWETIADAHMQCFADFLVERATDIKGRRQLAGLNEVDADFENIRSAWVRAIRKSNYGVVERMIEGLTLFCELRARYLDGEHLFQHAVALLSSGHDEDSSHLLKILRARWFKMRVLQLNDLSKAQEAFESLLEYSVQNYAPEEIAFCQRALGEIAYSLGNWDKALPYFSAARNHYETIEDHYYLGRAMRGLAMCYLYLPAYQERFPALNRQHIDVVSEAGDKTGLGHAIYYNGLHAIFTGRFHDAIFHLQDGAALWAELGDEKSVGISKSNISHIYVLMGRFEQAQILAAQGLEIAANINSPLVKRIALFVLGTVSSMNEDYGKAWRLFQAIQPSSSPRPITNPMMSWGLAITALGLGEIQEARQHIHRTCKFWWTTRDTQRTLWLLQCLPVAAIVLEAEGVRAHAIELLALALTHPGSLNGWAEKWPLMTRLRSDLKRELGDDVYELAWERGKSLDLETEIKTLMRHFQDADDTSHVANQALPEPLTQRELQILRLLAERRSNREIADELTVVLGTVKTHVYNICQKLNARNRRQAVVQARELNLL